MGSEWKTVRLGDHVEACLGKMLDQNKNQGTLHPYLGNKQVRWGRFDLNDLSEMKFQDHEHDRYGLKSGDLIVCEGGEPGRCAIWKDEVPNMKIQKALHRIRPNPGLESTFLNYWFCYAGKFELLEPYFTGTTIKHLTGKAIAELPIPLPPLPEQKSIAHILGSLDDKITLNRKMNATLEAMAQALFKSWFVDFDPVIDNALRAGNPIPDELADRAEIRKKALADLSADAAAKSEATAKDFPAAFQETEELGWIPKGWEAGKLSDLLEVKYGKDHKKLNEGSIPVYGSGGLMRHADKSLYTGESVLIPRKGTLSNILYLNEEFWTVDTMFYTIPKNRYAPKYTFYHLKGLDFASMNVGSAVPSMTTKVLNELPIVIPDDGALAHYDSILTSYFDKTEANNKQSQSLTKLRDRQRPVNC